MDMKKAGKVVKKGLQLAVINRSLWPTELIEILGTWIAERAGIRWSYTVCMKSGRNWHGLGGTRKQDITSHRHFRRYPGSELVPWRQTIRQFKKLWPWTHKDHRYQWAVEHTLDNRLESLVYLIAHEAYHATGGHPKNFRVLPRGFILPGTNRPPQPGIELQRALERHGYTNNASMEFRCNQFGMETVVAFREVWRTELKLKVVKAMRKARERRKAEKAKAANRRQAKSSPNLKLEAARKRLVVWQAKLKRAETAVKKYTRKVRYYERRALSVGV
jgi:hypothetical protein